MKINFIYLMIFVVLISCKNKNDQNNNFEKILYSEIIKYQDKYPIPQNSLASYFIYEVHFTKKQDTLLSISMNTLGIKDKNSYGIYRIRNSDPLYVVDSLNYGKKFIANYKKDSIDSFILTSKPPNTDIIYPIYTYKKRKKTNS